MSNVFKLFICILLFIELLLIDGCKYYNGQRVRLKDLKKDELNGKYGIINNKNNKNEERCGVLIDGTHEAVGIKIVNLDKIPTIFINGESHDFVIQKKLHDFITNHPQDMIGLEHGNKGIKSFKKHGLCKQNAFGFEDDMAKHHIFADHDKRLETAENSLWKQSIVDSMVFSDDEMFKKLETLTNLDLQEWRYFRMNMNSGYYVGALIGYSANADALEYIKDRNDLLKYIAYQDDFNPKMDKIQREMGNQFESVEQYLDVKAGLTKEKWNQVIDIWLKLTKKYLVDKLETEYLFKPFIESKYSWIYKETLDDYANIFKHHQSEAVADKHLHHMAIIRDIMSSQKIIRQYVENYKKGSNVYVFIGNGHVKILQFLIKQNLLKLKQEKEFNEETHVAITQIFPEWIESNYFRELYFQTFLEKTSQKESDCE